LGEATQGVSADSATKELFNQFSMQLPSNLPFTFQIEKHGDMYTVRGVVSINFLPGGDMTDYAEVGQDFETIFTDAMEEVLNHNKPGHTSYTMGTIFSENSGSVFAGIRGYLAGTAYTDPNTGSFIAEFQHGGLIGEVSGAISMRFPLSIFEFGYRLNGAVTLGIEIAQPTKSQLQSAVPGSDVRVNISQETGLQIGLTAFFGVGLHIGIASAHVGVEGGASGTLKQKTVVCPYLPAAMKYNFGAVLELEASQRICPG